MFSTSRATKFVLGGANARPGEPVVFDGSIRLGAGAGAALGRSKPAFVLTDDETTELQFAIDAGDRSTIDRLLAPLDPESVSSLQFYGNSTAFMYACERSVPEVAQAFLERGVLPFELPFSDNNELKAALRNRWHAPAMLALVLQMLPEELVEEMITSDWDPDDDSQGQAESALEMAEKLEDPSCKNLLLAALERHQAS